MTVSSDKNKVVYEGNGVTVTFTYDFRVDEKEDMKILLDGVLYEGAFDITDLGNDNGGDVTISDVVPAVGETVTLYRLIEIDQSTVYSDYDPFPADATEDAFDKLTMICQQLAEQVERAYKGPVDSVTNADFVMPDYLAGAVLGWSLTEENEIVNTEVNIEEINDAAEQALASAEAAALSETNAGVSEVNAKASELLAEGYAQVAYDAAQSLDGLDAQGLQGQINQINWLLCQSGLFDSMLEDWNVDVGDEDWLIAVGDEDYGTVTC